MFLSSGYYKKITIAIPSTYFVEHFLTCKAPVIKLQMLLQCCLVCGLRLSLTASIPLPRSCTVSDINLLCLRLESYILQFKRNVPQILLCPDKRDRMVYVIQFSVYNNALFQY